MLELALGCGPRHFFSGRYDVARELVERRLLEQHAKTGLFEITDAGRLALGVTE